MITEASDLLRFADAFNLLQRQLKVRGTVGTVRGRGWGRGRGRISL